MSNSRREGGLKRDGRKYDERQEYFRVSRNNNASVRHSKDKSYLKKDDYEDTKTPLETKQKPSSKIYYKVKVPKARSIECSLRACSLSKDTVTERYTDLDSVEEDEDRNDNHNSRDKPNWNQNSIAKRIYKRSLGKVPGTARAVGTSQASREGKSSGSGKGLLSSEYDDMVFTHTSSNKPRHHRHRRHRSLYVGPPESYESGKILKDSEENRRHSWPTKRHRDIDQVLDDYARADNSETPRGIDKYTYRYYPKKLYPSTKKSASPKKSQ